MMNMKTVVCLLVAVCAVNASIYTADDLMDLINWQQQVEEKLEELGINVDSLKAGVAQWAQAQLAEGKTVGQIQRMAEQWLEYSCMNGFDVEDEVLQEQLNQFKEEGGCDTLQSFREAAEVIKEDLVNTLDGPDGDRR